MARAASPAPLAPPAPPARRLRAPGPTPVLGVGGGGGAGGAPPGAQVRQVRRLHGAGGALGLLAGLVRRRPRLRGAVRGALGVDSGPEVAEPLLGGAALVAARPGRVAGGGGRADQGLGEGPEVGRAARRRGEGIRLEPRALLLGQGDRRGGEDSAHEEVVGAHLLVAGARRRGPGVRAPGIFDLGERAGLLEHGLQARDAVDRALDQRGQVPPVQRRATPQAVDRLAPVGGQICQAPEVSLEVPLELVRRGQALQGARAELGPGDAVLLGGLFEQRVDPVAAPPEPTQRGLGPVPSVEDQRRGGAQPRGRATGARRAEPGAPQCAHRRPCRGQRRAGADPTPCSRNWSHPPRWRLGGYPRHGGAGGSATGRGRWSPRPAPGRCSGGRPARLQRRQGTGRGFLAKAPLPDAAEGTSPVGRRPPAPRRESTGRRGGSA